MPYTEVMFTSNTDNWATPQETFDALDAEFHFTLDPCADHQNHKCSLYYTKEDDGLSKNWGGHKAFVNPPYGKDLKTWVKKAYEEGHKENTLVVMLIPARTDTNYFHDYILNRAEIRFIKSRLHFGGKDRAPFPSMVVIFRGPKM